MRTYADAPIPPACGVPPVARRAFDAALQTWGTTITGVADYWA
jgi:hypothetical protein